MADKKTLMICDVQEFIGAMNPKRECKRKGSSTDRTIKQRHKKSGS